MECVELEVWLLLLSTISALPHALACSPQFGMVHVSWDDRHVVQYQLGCSRWGYFCQDSGWGDEEATVVCREQGFSYGLSGYVPTNVNVGISRVECTGMEAKLQHCTIVESRANTPPVRCSHVGIIAACYKLPQVYVTLDELVSEEDSVHVCVHINGTLQRNISILLQTVDGSAIAGFDYVSAHYNLTFVPSGDMELCVEIDLIDDGLAEAEESFGIQLSSDVAFAEIVSAFVKVKPSDVSSSCEDGSITLSPGVNKGDLQLVEICSKGVWSPVCDHNWTVADSTVVCRELGYNEPGDVVMGSDVNISGFRPECEGSEPRLDDCSDQPYRDTKCHYVLVECIGKINQGIGATTNDSDNTIKVGIVISIIVMVMLVAIVALLSVVMWWKKRAMSRGYSEQNTSRQNQHSTPEQCYKWDNPLYTDIGKPPQVVSQSNPFNPIYHCLVDTKSSPTDHEYAVLEAPSVQGLAPVREIHFYEEIDGLQQDHQYALLEATTGEEKVCMN